MTYVPSAYLTAEDSRDDERHLGDWMSTDNASFDWSVLPHQYEAIEYSTEPDGAPERCVALLGSWGGGKSRGAAMAFLAACFAQPWTEAYGVQLPTSAIIAPTHRVLRHASLAALESVLPREAVRRRRGQPHNDILLSNGHLITMWSGEGEFDGSNLCNEWIDEIQHANFTQAKWSNYRARARDPKQSRGTVIASGLAVHGWVREVFDVEPSPLQRTILCSTASNTYLRDGVKNAILSAVASGDEAHLVHGGWQSVEGAVYPQYDPKLHIVDKRIDTALPVNLSIDVGSQAGLLITQGIRVQIKNIAGQTEMVDGLLVGDEYTPDASSVDEMCIRLKTSHDQYVVKPGVSVITLDPNTNSDIEAILRRHFPGVRQARKQRGDATFPIDVGVRAVKRGLKDALGNTRLFFSSRLRGSERGILACLPKLRYREGTDLIIKDNKYDHLADCLRYAVAELIQDRTPVELKTVRR